jgi:hypothetical protein
LDGNGEELANVNEAGKAGNDNGFTDVEEGVKHMQGWEKAADQPLPHRLAEAQLRTDVSLSS